MADIKKSMVLANGVEMPTIGYGTWRVENSPAGTEVVAEAIRAGYRHIDGAARYENEVSVGEGIKKSGIARKELFVTSKVWFTHRSYEKVLESCDTTLKNLGLVPLVKSGNPVRMRENLEVYDFCLSPEDMARIDALPRDDAGAEKPDELVER